MEQWERNLNNYHRIKNKYLINETDKLYEYNVGGFRIIEFKNTSIFIFKKYFDNKFCSELVQYIDEVQPLMLDNTNKSKKNVECKSIAVDDLVENIPDSEYISKTKDNIIENVSNLLGKLKKVEPFLQINNVNSGYALRKVYGKTRMHCDGMNRIEENVRTLALIVLLNSNYEGGEYIFPKHDIRVRLEEGDVILFPSLWTHPHLVTPLRNNTFRYTINTWFYETIKGV